MRPGTGLLITVGLVVAVTLAMAWVGAAGSWQYYLTADECVAAGTRLAGCRVRVSGTLSPGTLRRSSGRTTARFALETGREPLAVQFHGSLPESLKTIRQVVVEGRMDAAGTLHGDRLFTRCAGKYEAASSVTPAAGNRVTR